MLWTKQKKTKVKNSKKVRKQSKKDKKNNTNGISFLLYKHNFRIKLEVCTFGNRGSAIRESVRNYTMV